VGMRHSTIWIHDPAGDRPLSSEAYAFSPRMSADGKRVYYLLRQNPASVSSESTAPGRSSPFNQSGALWSVDIAQGKSERLLPGFSVVDYDISNDEKQVVFTTMSNENSQLWVAPFDRRLPPRMLSRSGGRVSFGADDEVFFAASEGERNFLYRMKLHGKGSERVSSTPVLGKSGTSPNGEWIAMLVPIAGQEANWQTVAMGTHSSDSQRICAFFCAIRWSPDGKFLYLDPDISGNSSPGKTFVLPIPAGRSLPDLPASGISSPADLPRIPGVRIIERSGISPGPGPSTYVFAKKGFEGNLFRIALR